MLLTQSSKVVDMNNAADKGDAMISFNKMKQNNLYNQICYHIDKVIVNKLKEDKMFFFADNAIMHSHNINCLLYCACTCLRYLSFKQLDLINAL